MTFFFFFFFFSILQRCYSVVFWVAFFSTKKLTASLSLFFLMYLYLSGCFKAFYFFHWFSVVMCFSVVFFMFFVLEVLWASWIFKFIILSNWKVFAYLFKYTFRLLFCILSSEILIIWLLVFVKLYHKFLTWYSFFSPFDRTLAVFYWYVFKALIFSFPQWLIYCYSHLMNFQWDHFSSSTEVLFDFFVLLYFCLIL